MAISYSHPLCKSLSIQPNLLSATHRNRNQSEGCPIGFAFATLKDFKWIILIDGEKVRASASPGFSRTRNLPSLCHKSSRRRHPFRMNLSEFSGEV